MMRDWVLVPYFAGIFVAIIVTAHISYRVGRRHQRAGAEEAVRSQVLTLQGATLGLLGLLLAFTLSMAEERFMARKMMIVDEANAIGTTYLRAQTLPADQREQSRALLRRYVAERIAFYDAGSDEAMVRASTHRSTALLGEIWALAAQAARNEPESNPVKLYMTSLNQTIDMEATRMASLYVMLPATLLGLLLLVAAIATGSVGYACGLSGQRGILALDVIPVLVALSCSVVLDLSHPRVGFIRASDYAMDRLHASMSADATEEGVADSSNGRP
jgi:hypothetical protein